MLVNAVEFEAKIDNDWKISIPCEYRNYFSDVAKVILLNKKISEIPDENAVSISEFDKKHPEYQEFINEVAKEYLYE